MAKTRLICVAMALLLSSACTYMKMNPPPDADKTFLTGNNSCYLATASNMLATYRVVTGSFGLVRRSLRA